jgi:hypothetical protein
MICILRSVITPATPTPAAGATGSRPAVVDKLLRQPRKTIATFHAKNRTTAGDNCTPVASKLQLLQQR